MMLMKSQTIRLDRFGRVLGTRALGAQAAELVRDTEPTKTVLIVDFDGVAVASSPFLDEVACALRAVIADRPEQYVILTRLNEDVADTMELVAERRKVVLTQLSGKKLGLLGGRGHLEETLEAARELDSFTAPDLAERLELKLPNLHQRLKQLQDAGALTRSEDPTAQRGRRHFYKTVPADEVETALC